MPEHTPTDMSATRLHAMRLFRLEQMTRLRAEVSAMASGLEHEEPMPGGGQLQASMDTAWNALIALYLGIEDWIARQDEDA